MDSKLPKELSDYFMSLAEGQRMTELSRAMAATEDGIRLIQKIADDLNMITKKIKGVMDEENRKRDIAMDFVKKMRAEGKTPEEVLNMGNNMDGNIGTPFDDLLTADPKNHSDHDKDTCTCDKCISTLIKNEEDNNERLTKKKSGKNSAEQAGKEA